MHLHTDGVTLVSMVAIYILDLKYAKCIDLYLRS